jgi:hypothetical protein
VAEEYTARWEATVASFPNQELDVAPGLRNLFIVYGIFKKLDIMNEGMLVRVNRRRCQKGGRCRPASGAAGGTVVILEPSYGQVDQQHHASADGEAILFGSIDIITLLFC